MSRIQIDGEHLTLGDLYRIVFDGVDAEISSAARDRSRFSKRLFNQSQLLAILCLMRYENWTFREGKAPAERATANSVKRWVLLV